SYFLRRIRPDLFILVETDFWPNFLEQLHRRNIPAILVNGRISQSSKNLYRRYSFFFKPMFSTFALVCAQSEADRGKFLDLGVESNKVFTLGNLKYHAVTSPANDTARRLMGATSGIVFIAGSTHADEELLLFRVFTQLKMHYDIRMVIAPRDISRCPQLRDLAQSLGLKVQLRSADRPFSEDIYLVDSLGELAAFYACGDICFVGGSLVACGGHNPLEPASLNKPVLFGPDMSDFEEISAALLTCQGAYRVSTVDDFIAVVDELISNPELRTRCGEAAGNCVRLHQGVVDKHIELIEEHI
ncbi:MAG TPA: glycosyltransferase N-terminal domain-containing protein, partial [Desulfopila sp.]|nr:glycosyltransferase N-terminal domain-containing protein [Desulfopila sp.]